MLSSEETNLVINTLEKQGIKIETEYELFQFLTINIVYKDPFIVFTVSIPKYSSETLKHIHIIPVTINNTFHIEIPCPYLILSQTTAKFLNEPCEKIEEMYYCNPTHMKDAKGSCVSAIVSGKPANCNIIEDPAPALTTIFHGQYIIINQQKKQPYSTNCENQRTKDFPSQALIKFINCSITIGNLTFNNEETIFSQMHNIIPFNDIQIENILKPLKLAEVSNWTIQNMEKMKNFQQISIPVNHHYTSWSITTTFIIIIIIYLCILRYCPSCTPCQWYKKIVQAPDFVEDNKNLGGEELRPGTSHGIFPKLPRSEII